MPPRGSIRRDNAVSNPAPPQTPPRTNYIFQIATQEDFSERLAAVSLDDNNPTNPPILASPIKRRRKGKSLNSLSDIEAWEYSDEEIIDAALTSWHSEVYNHYDVTLERNYNPRNQSPVSITYIFVCKTHPENHTRLQSRPRGSTSSGTSNLGKDVALCLKKQGISQPSGDPDVIPYSEANHRALIALRCAKNARPINMIMDEDYKKEVNMLRPGTAIPSPNTIQRDLLQIYTKASVFVMNYFLALTGAIYLVLDGWTAPLISSYLGLVVVWYEEGVIHRAILEFIRLKKKHDGKYLAQCVADCMKRWHLDKKLLGICMDNASNCNKLAEILPTLLPDFWGMDARLRCLAHIINLVAKIFISFFFKKLKLKKSVKTTSNEGGREVEAEYVLDDGELSGSDADEEDSPAVEEAAVDAEEAVEDDGEAAHDQEVVRSVRDIAIQEMALRDVRMTSVEEKEALKLFPAVAGLARRVHDSSTLNQSFQELVSNDSELETNKQALDRRVPTRWNSDFDCLAAHLHFKNVIESLTGVRENKLKAYRLSDEQWDLAEDVQEVLKADVPLAVEALPMLYNLRESLKAAVNDSPPEDYIPDEDTHPTPSVIRIAAHASVLLINKYIDFSWDCDIYIIAMDRKLAWFKDLDGITHQKLKEIRGAVVDCWNESYAETGARMAKDDHRPKNADPPIPSSVIQEAGGYMKYWFQASKTRPMLAKMAQNFCSAPATSVDAERAFSTGRRHVSFTQHNMNSQTFKARMAVGSWAKTPIFPDFSVISDIIKEAMGKDD